MDFLSTYSFFEPDFVPDRGWAAHLPFGFWLMDAARPNCCVNASSQGYLRFLAEQAGIPAAAAPIDILCIDQEHDLRDWAAKLSDRAVVLVMSAGVRLGYPRFEFTHSGGLSVIGVGACQPPQVLRLFEYSEPGQIRRIYERLGCCLTSQRDELGRRETVIEKLGAELDRQRRELDETHREELARARHELKLATAAASHYRSEYEAAIHSRSWQITRPLREGNGLRQKLRTLFHS